MEEIVAERQRFGELGIPPKHRRLWSSDLPKAAAVFVLAGVQSFAASGWPELFWPWPREFFQPGTSRQNLVRAGALVLFAIERLDRIAAKKRRRAELAKR